MCMWFDILKLNHVISTGGLFNYVAAPQYLGEVIAALGILIATSSVITAAHFLFVFCHMAVQSHMRYQWVLTNHIMIEIHLLGFMKLATFVAIVVLAKFIDWEEKKSNSCRKTVFSLYQSP